MQSTFTGEPITAETVGRYVLHAAIARGGMATVHAARLTGAEGFNRLVAAKRLHPEYTEDPEFVTMFHDEARIASRIHHPNVVPVLDVVVTDNEVMLVQEYVHGAPLSVVMRRARMDLKPIPTGIAVAIILGVLAGLHAAHEAKDDLGTPLDVIHRDVSPQNVMLSTEGIPRLLDFGIAKARTSAHQTRPGVMKGKLSYMAPEQIKLDPITRRADVYAVGVVLWELLANRRIGEGLTEADFLSALFEGSIPTLVEECSAWRRSMGQAGWKRLIALDAIVMRAISLRSAERYGTALGMAEALLAAHPPASQSEVASWLATAAGDHMEKLRRVLAQSEEEWRSTSRLEAATLSRKSIVMEVMEIPIDVEEDRVTVPSPRVVLAAEETAADEVEVEGRARRSELWPSRAPVSQDAADSSPPESVPAVAHSDAPGAARQRAWPWLLAAAAVFALSFVATRRSSVPLPALAAAPVAVTVTTPPLPSALLDVKPVVTDPVIACVPAASSAPKVVHTPAVSMPARTSSSRDCKPIYDPVRRIFVQAACRR